MFTSVGAAGAAIGLLAGGVLTDLVSWRWVMFVNVPIGLAIPALAPVFVKETARVPGRFDLAGAVTATTGSSGLVYGLVRASERGLGRRVGPRLPVRRPADAGSVRRGRTPRLAAGHAAPPARRALAGGRLRLDAAAPGRDARDVLLPDPVRPARAGLLPLAGRPGSSSLALTILTLSQLAGRILRVVKPADGGGHGHAADPGRPRVAVPARRHDVLLPGHLRPAGHHGRGRRVGPDRDEHAHHQRRPGRGRRSGVGPAPGDAADRRIAGPGGAGDGARVGGPDGDVPDGGGLRPAVPAHRDGTAAPKPVAEPTPEVTVHL